VKIHLIKQVGGNFGDELNRWMWPALLGDEISGADEDILFVGIGTILDQNLLLLAAATAHLDKLKASKGFLSSDHCHSRSLENTLSRLEGLKSDLRRKAFA
jgi:hypothetical protein